MTFFKQKDKYCCYNGGNKHNFVSVYTEVANPNSPNLERDAANLYLLSDYITNINDFYILKQYVKHVCVWCGKEINK